MAKKELNTLLEGFYRSEKPAKETIDFDMLTSMINEVLEYPIFKGLLEETYVPQTLPLKQPLEEQEEASAGRFSYTIPIPRLTPTEAWGNPNSQSRKDINRIFGSITGGADMKARIENVNTFLDPAKAKRKAPKGKTNTLLSMLQIIEALQACLNDYNESSAGFVFEGFMAALTAGTQIDGRIGGTLPIEDFVAFSEIDAESVPTSLKLLSPKTGIHGSFTNLMDYLFIRSEKPEQPESEEQAELQEQKERQHGNKKIKYLVAYKQISGDSVEKLSLFDFTISRDNIIDILATTGEKNRALLGDMAGPLKDHIKNHSNTPEWRQEMARLLRMTPGYTTDRGMAYTNLDDQGNFIDKEEVPKQTDLTGIEKKGANINMKNDAQNAGFEHSRENGPDFETWYNSLEVEALAIAGLYSKVKKTREARKDILRQYFDKGEEKAVATMKAKAEPPEEEPIVAESYFGHFHQREKELMKEEQTLMEGGSDGGSQWELTSTRITDRADVLDTVYYGVLDLSQENITQVAKIYIGRLGQDVMTLLETTKGFTENIGRYFVSDDRSEASQANADARAQGNQIVKSLKEREEGAEV